MSVTQSKNKPTNRHLCKTKAKQATEENVLENPLNNYFKAGDDVASIFISIDIKIIQGTMWE